MRPLAFIIGSCLLCFFSCKKEKKQPDPVSPEPTPVIDTILNCKNLPPVPQPFGWKDSTLDESKNVNAFFINPLNPNQVVCIVNGDITGFNKMILVDVPTGKITPLASTSDYLPQVNKKGWIVYSSNDGNIYKIKCNGDSLTQITYDFMTFDPKWDYTGNYIYYYHNAYNIFPSKLIKRHHASGVIVHEFPLELPHTTTFKNSDKIIYLKTKDNFVSLIQRDFETQAEKVLLTAPYNPKAVPFVFDNMILDNQDEHFYWSNLGGIFRCNLNTLKVDTVLKNCPNKLYNNPYILPSNPDALTYSRHELKPIGTYLMFHEFKAFQMNITTREITETRIFP